MKTDYIIKTQRLGLRKWQDSDAQPFAQINANKEVMKYFPYSLNQEQSNAYMNRIIQHQEEYGYCAYAVDHLESKEFIGYLGFMRPTFKSFFTPCVEIGWRLDNRFWNRGLATEGALACLAYGFNRLKFQEIHSFTALINKPSERIMQKIGMQKIGEFDHPSLEEKDPLKAHCLYLITKQ